MALSTLPPWDEAIFNLTGKIRLTDKGRFGRNLGFTLLVYVCVAALGAITFVIASEHLWAVISVTGGICISSFVIYVSSQLTWINNETWRRVNDLNSRMEEPKLRLHKKESRPVS